jgi:DNA-directed RNA polymerase subunit H (RpoH/RPB5)
MNYETIDVLYKSRLTLLKILAARGYDTTRYEKFGPIEVSAMVAAGTTNASAMNMRLERPGNDAQPITVCHVVYSLLRVKTRLNTFIEEVTGGEKLPAFDNTKEEVIVMTLEPIVDAFHAACLGQLAKKVRISFFNAYTLVNNPLEHALVPKHELLPATEHKAFLAANKIRSKDNLPIIRFHEDMIARIIGLVPGDIVKITRPSPSAGEYETYRVCSF